MTPELVGILTLVAVVLFGLILLFLLPGRVASAARSDANQRLEALDRSLEKLDRAVREEISRSRGEAAQAGAMLRDEVRASLKSTGDSLQQRLEGFGAQLVELSGAVSASLESFKGSTDARLQASHVEQTAKLDLSRAELTEASTRQGQELSRSMKAFGDSLDKRLADIAATLVAQLGLFGTGLDQFQSKTEARLHASQVEQAARLEQAKAAIAESGSSMRAELSSAMKGFGDSLDKRHAEATSTQVTQFDFFGARLEKLTTSTEKQLQEARVEAANSATTHRTEVARSLTILSATLVEQVTGIAALLRKEMEIFSGTLQKLTDANEKRLNELRVTVDAKLQAIQEDNARRLESMRQTVDEKLQGTLEKRLGESFKFVGDRLEAVQAGLGEMRTLANGVGDLKKVLSNVKVRGTWGEIQLGNLLAQVLAPEQYATNVVTKPHSSERVEFAIRFPGGEDGEEVLVPIDSKFPIESYTRLVEASERGDPGAVEACSAELEQRIRTCAQDISAKYLNPPHTTDFGILFLPTEGLYAEVIRRNGLVEGLQRDYRVAVAGPTTLAALLNSLQMGFRTLAIQKRSSEVWQILAAVKSEFGKFGEVIDAVDKKLAEASKKLGTVGTRSRAIERKLRDVEVLPVGDPRGLLLGQAESVLEPVDLDEPESPK